MYFKQIDEIINGTKTQTRRVCKPNEAAFYDGYVRNIESVFSRGVQKLPSIGAEIERYRLKWQVGRDYAVSPGRGMPADNWDALRIRITEIRREKLQDISAEDAIAEGINEDVCLIHNNATPEALDRVARKIAIERYRELWESINTHKGTRWEDNPDVWVLVFEVVR